LNNYTAYTKLYNLIFGRRKVFSQSDGQGLALLGDLKNVRPELKPD
jgi:hypothetical protein